MGSGQKSQFRSFDAFAKPIDGVRSKTVEGGVVTVVASTAALLLLVSQLFLYMQVDVRRSLALSQSHPLSFILPSSLNPTKLILDTSKKNKGGFPDMIHTLSILEKSRIKVSVHVTFPHMNCEHLDFSHDGASLENGKFLILHGPSAIIKRIPTEFDMAKATGQSTFSKSKQKASSNKDSCSVRGEITVPRIAGEFTISVASSAWQDTVMSVQRGLNSGMFEFHGSNSKLKNNRLPKFHNVSHYIHDISFGDQFPLTINPLSDTMDAIHNQLGIALTTIIVKLIPTKYKKVGRRHRDTYQTSVTKYVVQPETLAAQGSVTLPGLSIQYDYNPLTVIHVETRENVFVFLSSLISIVGGVFVTISLITSFMLKSVVAVAKKRD